MRIVNGRRVYRILSILDRSIPDEVYEGLLSLLAIGVVVILAIKGLKSGWRGVAIWTLVEFLFNTFLKSNEWVQKI